MKFGYLIIIIYFFSWESSLAQCGGSFGEPVFVEDFGVQIGDSVYAGALPNGVTTYSYRASDNVQDGFYTVSTSPVHALSSFHNIPDNTNDANGAVGNMLVVNASFIADEFYRRRVTNLCNSQNTYRFSAYLLNVLRPGFCNPDQPVNVRFQVYSTTGVLLGEVDTGNIFQTNNPVWQEFFFEFTLPVGVTEVDVVLSNNGLGGCGNDLAIDDISFTICGEELQINADDNIFDEMVCTPLTTNLTADIGSNNILNPEFEWQISTNNGASWNALNCGSNNENCTIQASEYTNGNLIRYSVVSQDDSNDGCKLFSNPFQIRLLNFSISDLPRLNRYSLTSNATFNLLEVIPYIENNTQFNIADLNISFFEDENQTVLISNHEEYDAQSKTIYVKIEHQLLNCETLKPLELLVNPAPEFTVCDEDSDGITLVDYSNLLQFIENSVELNQSQEIPTIYMTRANNGIVELKDLEGNQEYNVLCNSLNGVSSYFELAVNNREEVFLVTGNNQLLRVNITNCTYETINASFVNNIAMSFDTENNLYSGHGGDSRVYVSREDDNYATTAVWHDFQIGQPAGDFIELNGKLYISWSTNSGEFLYEVTLDENKNYVSHLVLGNIRNNTFGMAGEQGILYGVTTSQVYRIDLNPFQLTTIFNNPSGTSGNRWFGAAGRREAQIIQSLYLSEENALNEEDGIVSDFENINAFQDVVYYRLDNDDITNPIIIPVSLNVNPAPPVPELENEYIQCKDAVELNTNISGNFAFEWYFNGDLMAENTSTISTDDSGEYRVVIRDLTTDCTSEAITNVTVLNPFISDVQINTNTVTIIAQGGNNLEYSFDGGISWLDQNSLTLENGDYQLFVRVEGNCISDPFMVSINSIDSCKDPVPLNTNITGNYSYQWFLDGIELQDFNNNPSIIAQTSGVYEALITNLDTGLKTLFYTNITITNPVITNVEIVGNRVIVTAVGGGDIEYSYNGIDWQQPNDFILENGDYQLFVRIDDCESSPYPITIFFISNFFTPNGDGINDTWQISNLQNYPGAQLSVYDRYGKKIFETNAEKNEIWDGTYLGSNLPSSNYWYILTIDKNMYSGFINIKRK